MTITFTAGANPAPLPVADLLRRHLSHRPNMNTAANSTSPWLFPGYRPGQPLTSDRVQIQLRAVGVSLRAARNSALRQLVMDMPPAVAAGALGYSTTVAEYHAHQAGATWSGYATARTAHLEG